jgi:hypothetical protein
MDRSLWAVLAGTFTLRFSTGMTGALLGFYFGRLAPPNGNFDAVKVGIMAATFYLAEMVLAPPFGLPVITAWRMSINEPSGRCVMMLSQEPKLCGLTSVTLAGISGARAWLVTVAVGEPAMGPPSVGWKKVE